MKINWLKIVWIVFLVVVAWLAIASFALACPEGCTPIDKGTCACDAKDDSAYQPTHTSDEKPRRNPQPEWMTGGVIASTGTRAVEPSSSTAHDYHEEQIQQRRFWPVCFGEADESAKLQLDCMRLGALWRVSETTEITEGQTISRCSIERRIKT